MLKLKFYVKGNASQMDQRFCSSVSSDKKDWFSSHVLILFGKLPSSFFSSSSQFKAMSFLISCLMCSIIAYFRRMNQTLFTYSVCIIEVDLYLHLIYDVKTICRRSGHTEVFRRFWKQAKRVYEVMFFDRNSMYILKVYLIHKHKC